MEPGVAAAAYGVETAAEGAIGASVAIAKPTMPLKASWRRVPSDTLLPRSSHSLSIIKGKAYIFGGEKKPREQSITTSTYSPFLNRNTIWSIIYLLLQRALKVPRSHLRESVTLQLLSMIAYTCSEDEEENQCNRSKRMGASGSLIHG